MKKYFSFLILFFIFITIFFSISVMLVNAGVLNIKVLENNDGIHGSKIIITWYQGDDKIKLGPDQCKLNGIPGDNVSYAFKNSDSSFYPNTDSDPTGCNYCGGNTACNEGLQPGVEDYYCDYSDGSCVACVSCPQGCGVHESCDTSKGTCNSKCVCDDALCSGSVCLSKSKVRSFDGCQGNECEYSDYNCPVGCIADYYWYDGCSDGVCPNNPSKVYDCPNCQDKITNTYEICVRNADCTYSTATRTETVCPGEEHQSCTDPDTCECLDFGSNCDGSGSGLG